MRPFRSLVLLAIGLPPALAFCQGSPPAARPTGPAAAAARKSLALIQRGAANYVRKQDCFSCHHQGLTMMTCALAMDRGLPVDARAHQQQIDFTTAYFEQFAAELPRGLGVPGANDTVGYALAGLGAARRPPDGTTHAMARFLVRRQLPEGNWIASAERPPLEGSEFTATALALQGIRDFGAALSPATVEAVVERARGWLRGNAAKDTEDRVYQLRGLALAGDAEGVRTVAAELQAAQRPDGGWSQLPELRSDAYATGQALLALNEGSGLAREDPVLRRGIDFLLGAQLPDGSWRVQTRARPLQAFFDNGDPHGRSQFISFAATNLATQALLRALPPTPGGALSLKRKREAQQRRAAPRRSPPRQRRAPDRPVCHQP